ncbi:BppU family phage baseplate upper protein [Enterococcus casseliflavus]|uniref:BppU family phage baseplate upper protein n=1 Tax=Enterococcus casseliflavus TaxID=37734 RepID=UPI002DBAF5CA|nr:BppU family phage baseplate upper protein [Enterococcus casseliflavus]MEB6179687.1 BppU family phage baseplate upper protein [Enterococcus casseliflavus]
MENLYVTSEITLNKTAEKRSSPIPTNTEFFSFDQRVAKKTINFQFEGEPLDLSEANVILGFDFVTAGQSVIFESADGSIKIEDPASGKVNVMLPNDIYAYSGSVIIYVFVEFSNGQSLDYPAFSTEFQESWLEQDLDEMAQFYVKRFEDLRKLVLEEAAGIDHDLTGFEDRIQQIEADLASLDVESLVEEVAEEIRASFESRLSDIEERLEDSDVITQEMMDQSFVELLSGKKISIDGYTDFFGKVRESLVESPHIIRQRLTASFPRTSTNTNINVGTEITQEQYNTLAIDDQSETSVSNTSASGFIQILVNLNLLEHFKRTFPELNDFFSGSTAKDELRLFSALTSEVIFTVRGRAHIGGGRLFAAVSLEESGTENPRYVWKEKDSHRENTPQELSFTVQPMLRGISATDSSSIGEVRLVLYGDPRTAVTNTNRLLLSYMKVEYRLKYSIFDLISLKVDSPTQAMHNDLAQRVNELEKRG